MASVSNATGVFTGISALYVLAAGATGAMTEVPCAEDGGFTYNGGTPSVENYRIHGLSTPWTAKMTPGDTEISLFVPQVTTAILGLFGFTTGTGTAPSIGSAYTVSAGIAFGESAKEVTLSIAALSADETQLFYIKKAKLLATIVFDEANSAKPVGIQLTGTSASGTDTDGIAICTVAPASN